MKKVILLLLLGSTFTADAQSLKDLLYSGKLKKDSSGVIRKTDDLSARIDTSTKKEAETPKPVVTSAPVTESAVKTDNTTNPNAIVQDSAVNNAPVVENAASTNTAPPKTNTKLLKEYTDSLVASLKDVLSNKKIKKESYFFNFEYEIDVDGQVSVTNVTVSPDNNLLLEQVRERLLTAPPHLNPVMDSSNKPRKVKRRQSFTVTKE